MINSSSSFDGITLPNYHNDESNEDIEIAKVKDANEWANNNSLVIMTPTGSLEELEDKWLQYNAMIKKHRRESDWKSIELFGTTNQEIYDKLKSSFITNDISKYSDYNTIDEYIKSEDSPVVESFVDSGVTDTINSYYDTNASVNYKEDEVKNAKEWSNNYNRFIIVPTRTLEELENLWDSYNAMIDKHRQESDWKSIELFGMTNIKHYEYLKSKFLSNIAKDYEEEKLYDKLVNESSSLLKITDAPRMIHNYLVEASKTEPKIEIIKSILELYGRNNSLYDETLINNAISDVLINCDEVIPSITNVDIDSSNIPYINPEEMIDMGVFGQTPAENYYGVLADNTNINDEVSVKEWFELYRASKNGFYNEFAEFSSDWFNKVKELTSGLEKIKESKNEKAILARKQSILELGWDPDVEFTDIARNVSREIYRESAMVSKFNTKFIDLREFNSSDNKDDKSKVVDKNNKSAASKVELKPIFIVLSEGKALISKVIKKATKNIYSHSGISFDPNLKTIYSFLTGGIQTENIKSVQDGRRIGVYTFFVDNEKYKRIKQNIQYYLDNREKTHYSVLNLLTYLFKIPVNMEWNMICSQFVDKMLKLAEIDISKKDPSQVSPADFSKILKDDRRVYTIYKGLGERYNGEKTKKLVESLAQKARPVKEANSMYYDNEFNYVHGLINNIYDIDTIMSMREYSNLIQNKDIYNALNEYLFVDIKPYCEVKEFPIQFDKEGNLLISSLKKINYENEYAKSHKLLREYITNANIEGIKYELAKLWMLNISIENKIYSKKDLPSLVLAELHKSRAKILNDFKYYLQEVNNLEPDFNFTKYYESTPFSANVTKINNTTMSSLSNMIKTFIKPF